MIIDESNEDGGVFAISLVNQPAIESDFIALSKEHEIKFSVANEEKRLLIGPALIPNKTVFRRANEEGAEDYYIYFSKDTIRKTSELFFKNKHQDKTTLEHKMELNGQTVVESWIVEDSEKDKSAVYGMSMPVGTWMIAMKVENDDVWKGAVETGEVKGFSIEGLFIDSAKLSKQKAVEQELSEDEKKIEAIKKLLKEIYLETYSDYPDGVKNNAKRGIELNEKNGNKCATQTGKVRAQQLANGEAVSVDTIKRMYSYLSRAEEYYDESDSSACGTISYLLWGGKAALRWSESKLKELGELE